MVCRHVSLIGKLAIKQKLPFRPFSSTKMAKSKFEYVRDFEQDDRCLPNCWIVVRVDGKGFHKFSKKHEFEKPNDERALNLMTRSAVQVMREFREIVVAYGHSDEYSLILKKDALVYNRRASKIMTNICSLFTSAYVFHWTQFFPSQALKYPPSFDSRVVLYPTDKTLRDYLSWRQADCHINNLYNTAFWALVQEGGMTPQEGENRLCGTTSGDKNELLFSQFGVNYNNLPQLFRKGTTVVRTCGKSEEASSQPYKGFEVLDVDIIGDAFWEQYPNILGVRS